ncbi:unnamed protein product [Gemmataceae bacterium]|nr:unnamed protein product [Gemmataceae bacterium]VTT99014.1 unnamed protein product [Gemmataceae bacterium]
MSVTSVCPRCRTGDEYLNVGRCHWGVCRPCGTRWPIGANVFSSWRDETEDDWWRNAATLERLEEVEPHEPPLGGPETCRSRPPPRSGARATRSRSDPATPHR